MKIAKIVKSNSHVDYVGRVIDALDAENPPAPEDYGFAQFVALPLGEAERIVGVIYDSILLNPEYASLGPRLSPPPELGSFSPDYINEQGVLIGILLLGETDRTGRIRHGVPRRVVPAGGEVLKIEPDETSGFHRGEDGSLQIHYYPQVIAHAGPFAVPLLEAIIDQLTVAGCREEDKKRLGVLKQTLTWQRTLGGMRL